MPWVEILLIGATVAIYALLARVVLRRAEADRVDEWALFNAVVLTAETEPVVHRYLDNRCWLRRVGAVSGLVIAPSFTAAFGIDLGVTGAAWMLLGYLVGVVVAELTLARVPGNGGRVASLVTRRVRSYAPPLLLAVQAVLPAIALVLSGLALLLTDGPAPGTVNTFDTGVGQRIGTLWAGPVALLIAAVVFAGQRYLVRRPQPVGAPDVVAVDDAMRTSAVRLIGATGATVAALLLSAQAWYLGNQIAPGEPVGSTLITIGGVVGPLVALACWFGRLPRGYRLRPPAAVPVASTGEGI